MKKRLAALLTALSLLPTFALAQEYYTLPEIKEQAKDGWHETYIDKYGRETNVDIDVEVYGDETAPVIKIADAGYSVNLDALLEGEEASNMEYHWFMIEKDNPWSTVLKVAKKGGRRTHFFRTYGEAVDLDRAYGAEIGAQTGNDLTVRQMYAYMAQIFKRHGIELREDDFEFAHPQKFDVMANVEQKTGEIVTQPFYAVDLWTKINGLPIMAHAIGNYFQMGWPGYTPRCEFSMMNEDRYGILLTTMKEKERLADDIPLCSLETVIESIGREIQAGRIQKVYSLRFGYALYNEPGYPADRSGLNVDNEADYYAVPSWVIECAYMHDAKETYVEYDAETLFEKYGADGSNRNTLEFRTMVVDAQTGEFPNPRDTSKGGYGNPDYRGFVSWDEVR